MHQPIQTQPAWERIHSPEQSEKGEIKAQIHPRVIGTLTFSINKAGRLPIYEFVCGFVFGLWSKISLK